MKIGPGVQVGPYQVVEQVGRGGMATVFKAYQPALERMVAIKVLPDFLAEDPEFRERFRREAVAIAKLRHPSILAVFDHGELDGQLYIVTEFVEGGTFAGELGKPLDAARVAEVLDAIASALDYAHQHGVLHRDVKPSNILVNKEGAAVLGDFGLARMMAAGERLTRLDMVVGTPEYMSPEQCAGKETGPASDQYSLAVVAFEALTGHVPYHAETPAAVMLAQMQSPLPLSRAVNPRLSEASEKALLRALAKTPAERFRSCGEFARAVTAAPGTVELPPARAVAGPRISWRPSRVPVLVASALVATVVVAGVGYAVVVPRLPHLTASTSGNAPSHGALVYDLKLSSGAWPGSVAPSPDPAGSVTIGYGASSLDVHIAQSGGGLGCQFAGPALKQYVADFQFRTDPGSDFEMNWQIRGSAGSEDAEVDLNIQVANEAMTLYLSPYQGEAQTLVGPASLAGVQGGRTVHVAVSVSGNTITVYVDGHKAGTATETKSTGAASPSLYIDGASGTLHILSLRYYAIS